MSREFELDQQMKPLVAKIIRGEATEQDRHDLAQLQAERTALLTWARR